MSKVHVDGIARKSAVPSLLAVSVSGAVAVSVSVSLHVPPPLLAVSVSIFLSVAGVVCVSASL